MKTGKLRALRATGFAVAGALLLMSLPTDQTGPAPIVDLAPGDPPRAGEIAEVVEVAEVAGRTARAGPRAESQVALLTSERTLGGIERTSWKIAERTPLDSLAAPLRAGADAGSGAVAGAGFVGPVASGASSGVAQVERTARPGVAARDERVDSVVPVRATGGEDVRIAMEDASPRFWYCYEARQQAYSQFDGRLEVEWTVVRGRATDVRVIEDTVGDDELAACVTARVAAMRFPKNVQGRFSWPFVFRPALRG